MNPPSGETPAMTLKSFFVASLAALFLPLALFAQPSAAPLVNRYIVVYSDAQVPSDAESRTQALGARLLTRHNHFGLAVVETASPDAARRLSSQPGVALVLHDRILTADRIMFRPPSVSMERPAMLHPRTQQEATLATEAHHGAPISSAPAPTTDTFYTTTPQGWAVRQVGGYGNNIPGGSTTGPLTGPWNTTRGKGIRIAILDSGLDATHPDIAPNLAFNLSGVDQNPLTGLPSPCDDGSAQDQQGHGTWVASLAAAAAGAGTGQTIGVAPEASLLNIKVLQRMPNTTAGSSIAAQCSAGQASGLLSWVIQGIQDAIEQHADIISLSLGTVVDLYTGEGGGLKATFDRITHAATQAGAIVIASAGNDGFDLNNPRYIELPAQSRDVLAVVASTNPTCAEDLSPNATCKPGPVTLPYYSNFGKPLNAVAAPGGNYPTTANPLTDTTNGGWIRGACSSGKPSTEDGLPADQAHSEGCFNLGHQQYVQAMGTSASAPLVAGVAALLKAAHPTWDAYTLIARIRATTSPIPGTIYGVVDASAALATN